MKEPPADKTMASLLRRLRSAFAGGETSAPPPPATKEVTPPPPKALAATTAPEAEATPKKKTRSGSETRQRQSGLMVRLTAEERESIQTRARAAGLSLGAYFRKAALETEGIRARPAPSVNREMLAEALAALNRVGNNVNQIAHHLNAGGSISSVPIADASVAVKEAAKTLVAALGRDTP